MGPEEMKNELEQFLNRGLREGWTGWPVKVEACVPMRHSGQWLPASTRSWLGGCDGVRCPVSLRDGSFARLGSLC